MVGAASAAGTAQVAGAVRGRLVQPALAKANRVVVLEGGARALMPLEVHPGGLALVDVSDARAPRLLAHRHFTGPRDTCYCACAKGRVVYAFAAKASELSAFEIVG